MNLLDTLRFLKKDIKCCIWNNDPTEFGRRFDLMIDGQYIIYNEKEINRYSKDEILSVNQEAVNLWKDQQKSEIEKSTLEGLKNTVHHISDQLKAMEGKV
jgi:hypothetical protein